MNPVLIKPEADTRSQVVVLGEADHAISQLPWRERRAAALARRPRVAARPARRLRRRRDRGRGQPGRDQPARRRHRQHGGRARGRGARAAVLRHRPRRRVRAPARHVALPGGRRSAICSRASCSTASAATRRCSRPGPPGSRSAPACRRSASSRGSTSRCPRRTASRSRAPAGDGRIAIVALPRIANLDEFAPLGDHARYVRSPAEIEAAAAIVIPGTKSTLADLDWLRATGLAGAIARRAAAGVPVLGICGGLQMLGRSVRDPHGRRGRRRGARPRPARSRDRAAGRQDDAARAR